MAEKKTESAKAEAAKAEAAKAVEQEQPQNYFEVLSSINVNGKVKQKNGLSYLSWAWAWSEIKRNYPDTTYTVYENAQGWNYHTDGRTCWVKVGVTVNGIEHVEQLPVMDFKNKAIPIGNVTSFEVNKAVQRCLTKAIARHGLGLYIYAGEDLPEPTDGQTEVKEAATAQGAPDKYDSMAPRKALVAFTTDNGLDLNAICKTCNITNGSSDQEFKDALTYARGLLF